ncbi:MAG: zinc-ribbon domain containing protein [Chloroflexota bacterium]
MSTHDKLLRCLDCADSFNLSAPQQSLNDELGFGTPNRCPPCRASLEDTRRTVGVTDSFRLLELAGS